MNSASKVAAWFSSGLIAATLLTGSGCGKKPEPPPPAPAQQSSGSVADLVGKPADAPPAPAAVAPVAPPTGDAPKSDGGLPDSQRIYDGIQKYMASHQGRAAKSLEELVAGGYLPPLPPPPPGKKYELNQRFATLTVVDK